MSFTEFKFFTNCKTFRDDSECFAGCTSLKTIDLSNITLLSGINGYQRGGFENCTSLVNVILNKELTAIGYNAFNNCTSLVNIDIPNTVTTIYQTAFYNCLNLVSVGNLSNVTKIYSDAFKNCQKLTDVNLLNVEYIEYGAFANSAITSVIMPKVKTLSTGTDGYSWGAFLSCRNLLSCDFGACVESIGWGLLNGCKSLKYIIFRTVTPPAMSTSTFDDTNNCPIYVPDGSLDAYKSATNWSTYTSRISSLTQFSTDFPNG